MFSAMKQDSSDDSDELAITGIDEIEFGNFLNFFSIPECIFVELDISNIRAMVKLADKYICPIILAKCREFLLRNVKDSRTTVKDRTLLINVCFKYFPDTVKDAAISMCKLSQIDFDAIENYESIRPLISRSVSCLKNLPVQRQSFVASAHDTYIRNCHPNYLNDAKANEFDRVPMKLVEPKNLK